MASSYLVFALRVEGPAAVDLKNQVTSGTVASVARFSRSLARMIQRTLKACDGGSRNGGNLYATILDSTAALPTGNIACVQANAATDTITFTYGGKTIVLTEGTDFLRGADNTACAANLAAAINAHPILGALYTALGSSGNCGLTGKVPTALMHDIAMSTNDGTAFSFTQLSGGSEGAAQWFLQHFPLNRTP